MLVTVIIPTLCEGQRRVALLRAIDSIHAASEGPVKILVVVNGQRFDPDLLNLLLSRTDLQVTQIAEGSLTQAHLVGRRQVDTEFFAFLDDDDEYLPGGLDARLERMQADPHADLLVTNGFSNRAGQDRLTYSRMDLVSANPLTELFEENWLHNCNHLFRSSSVVVGYFEDPHPYMEWTWLGFRLAFDQKRVISSTTPTFRYHDTPGSLSKSPRFAESRVALYQRMLLQPLPRPVDQTIRSRLANAWHDISALELQGGRRARAVSAHLRSLLAHRSGLRFLSFTRKLFY